MKRSGKICGTPDPDISLDEGPLRSDFKATCSVTDGSCTGCRGLCNVV